jgi:hypothetical protein
VNSSITQRNPSLRQAFHATAPRYRDHHFDTLKFVQQLQGEGFTEDQSVAMMKVLNDVIEERYGLQLLLLHLLYSPPKSLPIKSSKLTNEMPASKT